MRIILMLCFQAILYSFLFWQAICIGMLQFKCSIYTVCSFYSWETCPSNLILMIEKCVTKLMQLDPTDIAKNQQEFIKL